MFNRFTKHFRIQRRISHTNLDKLQTSRYFSYYDGDDDDDDANAFYFHLCSQIDCIE